MDAISQTIMYFHKGGLVMWPLLLCSLTAFAVGIERFLFYQDVDSGQDFTMKYSSLLREDRLEEAVSLARKSGGRCAEMVAAAQSANGTRLQKQAYLESQAVIFIARLRNRLDYLSVIVTLSPLLGLLGTIVGMIGAFSIFNLEAGAPLAITGGIGEALIATATGLCVAIVALCFHSYFSHWMDNIITNMEQCFSALLEAAARRE